MPEQALARTPLYDLHVSLGGKMVPFAGYDMPVQYPTGILAEHLHTRSAASLFDVSHMGQVRLDGAGAARALEALVPGDIEGLGAGRMRYTLFTNEAGGILDDLMVTNRGDHLFLVVNAACKDADIAHLSRHMGEVRPLPERALLALQGPAAASRDRAHRARAWRASVHERGAGQSRRHRRDRVALGLYRRGRVRDIGAGRGGRASGAPPARRAGSAARGIGRARHAPPRGGLVPLRPRHRRDDDADRGRARLDDPEAAARGGRISGRCRDIAGSSPQGQRACASASDPRTRRRRATRRRSLSPDGRTIGRVTSGGFGPSVGGPIAMGYVEAAFAAPGVQVGLVVRGSARPARVVTLPFVPHRYLRP